MTGGCEMTTLISGNSCIAGFFSTGVGIAGIVTSLESLAVFKVGVGILTGSGGGTVATISRLACFKTGKGTGAVGVSTDVGFVFVASALRDCVLTGAAFLPVLNLLVFLLIARLQLANDKDRHN